MDLQIQAVCLLSCWLNSIVSECTMQLQSPSRYTHTEFPIHLRSFYFSGRSLSHMSHEVALTVVHIFMGYLMSSHSIALHIGSYCICCHFCCHGYRWGYWESRVQMTCPRWGCKEIIDLNCMWVYLTPKPTLHTTIPEGVVALSTALWSLQYLSMAKFSKNTGQF